MGLMISWVFSMTISTIVNDDSQRYLGVDFSRKLKSTRTPLFQNLIEDLRAIAESIIFPWQKIDSYIIFNIPIREFDRYGHFEVKNTISMKSANKSKS